jgi:hypothetical protein
LYKQQHRANHKQENKQCFHTLKIKAMGETEKEESFSTRQKIIKAFDGFVE